VVPNPGLTLAGVHKVAGFACAMRWSVVTAVRVLSSGIDSLYLSASGHLSDGLTLCLSRMVEMAAGEPVPFSFDGDAEADMVLRLHGWRGYPYWISSPRFEVCIGASKPFPPVYVQLHSAYIHAVGVEAAVEDAGRLLLRHMLTKGFTTVVSRIDVYADEQGWEPVHDDFFHFVCRGVRRRLYEVPREMHGMGRQLSGFTFGAGDIVARVYDKTLETRARGVTWPALLWDGADAERSVWRVEFQYRRRALSSFGIRGVGDALRGRQDLWDYGMRWLSLRRKGRHADRDRWHESQEWAVLRGAQLGSPRSYLVRERIHGADELRLVRGLVGYATSLAALGSTGELAGMLSREVPATRRYLTSSGQRFDEIVERKRSRRVTLPAGFTSAAARREVAS